MIIVIIAGGSGTRLWPLSTTTYPKQLLKLTNKERTALQTTYDRVSTMSDIIYVVTEASHSDKVRQQLPELPEEAFLVEPGRRGTSHCILYALDVISRQHKTDEPIAFISADHQVQDADGFKRSFELAAKASKAKNEIGLVGAKPTFPSTGFGYIEIGEPLKNYKNTFQVKSFKEKPEKAVAQKYLDSGNYLWNCGYFVGSVDTFLQEMKQSAPELLVDFEKLTKVKKVDSQQYQKTYLSFGNDSIDFALMEKAKELLVTVADFDWMDVGSFNDLYDVLETDDLDNYISGSDVYVSETKKAYIRNEDGQKPVVVIGLENVVVVNTPNGILVSRKEVSSKVGSIAKKIQG